MNDLVLVTGGSGYVAGWCILTLLRRGYAVRSTVRDLGKAAATRAALIRALERDPGESLSFVQADLTQDDGWDAAVAGCRYVLHVASPLGIGNPTDADALVTAARGGALRVLRAALDGDVERVVMTSSCAACAPPQRSGDSFNGEEVWTDPSAEKLIAYRLSKVLAEKAAWDFVAGLGQSQRLTTILPSAVFGPVLTAENLGSVQIIARLLAGRVPANPRIGFCVVDVRDVAEAHVSAMTTPDATGERFVVAGEFQWLADLSATLRLELGPAAAKVPSRSMPDFVLRFLSLFDVNIRQLTPGLGHKHVFSAAKAGRLLGWKARPTAETVVDCARSLIAAGVIKGAGAA